MFGTHKGMSCGGGSGCAGEGALRRGPVRGRARRLAVCAGLLAALAPLPALAAAAGSDDEVEDYTKDQVVYVKADAEGDTQGVYVVNQVDAGDDGTVVEEAGYQAVQNLTDLRDVSVQRGEVTYEVAEGETFYYRGDLSATTYLPWDVEATYFLDGDEVDPEELSGAEGELTMVLSIAPSRAYADSPTLATYVDNYLLQVTATLDGDQADNIDAPDATAAKVGTDTQLTYMVMPGQTATLVVKADVTDFAFDGWQVVGVPLALSIDVDAREVMGDNADVDALADGIAEVNDGASQVASGASELADGADTLASSSDGLTAGSAEVASGISSASDGAASLSSAVSDNLVVGAEELASGSATYSSSLANQASDARDAASAVDVEAVQGAYEAAMQNYVAAYVQCTLNGGDPASDEATVNAQAALQQALTDLVGAQAAVAGYQSAADALDGAASGYSEIDAGIQGLVDEEAESSVYTLRDGASELADGLASLDESYGDLDQGIGDYTAGVADLQQGARELADGAGDLADGTQQLADETADLSDRIADEVETRLADYLNPEFTMVDFANGSTDHIGTVQFAFMTEAIEAPDDAAEADGTAETAGASDGDAAGSQTFWEKLTALFE